MVMAHTIDMARIGDMVRRMATVSRRRLNTMTHVCKLVAAQAGIAAMVGRLASLTVTSIAITQTNTVGRGQKIVDN